jgi:hypothetical protein
LKRTIKPTPDHPSQQTEQAGLNRDPKPVTVVFTLFTSDDPDLRGMVLRLGLRTGIEKQFGITCNDMPHCMCDDREFIVWESGFLNRGVLGFAFLAWASRTVS